METLQRLGADDLKAIVVGYRDALRAHQDEINRLNVYPVPDGDTGTNMALTLESVVGELDGATDMAQVCKAISHGSLMGARGNSGVILSQILRGIAKGFESSSDGGGTTTADAFAAASDAAYLAVQRPVEGTILTVCRAAATAATNVRDEPLVDVLEAARVAASEALAATPDQLPALKQAGVVDAGGAGFALLIDAFLTVADGRPLPEPSSSPGPVLQAIDAAHDSISDLRYEVMYLLEAPDETLPAFREVWAGIGDSIVVVGGDGIWNCHIHTDDIGAAVEAALDVGRPRQIRVTDLIEQVEEERWVREAPPSAEEGGPGVLHAGPVTTAVVAIVAGAGVGRLFRSVGVQAIVAGGQSMNPSTEQILEAAQACPADSVVILPNNKNIIPVAEQVIALTDKDIRVVPTRSLTEGLAAAFVYDPEGSGEDNERGMVSAVGNVVTGEITTAVRDALTDAGPVKEGEYIGMTRDGIAVVAPTLDQAGTALLEALLTDDHEIVTILEGEGATAGATRHISEWARDRRPDVMVEVHHGGQPVYPYLFSIEEGATLARTLPQLRRHSVSELRGIGPRKVEALAELEILSVLDLLTHYPRRYIDRSHQTTIDQLKAGEEAVLLVTVRRASTRRSRTGKSITEVDVVDESRKTLRVSFFNQPWRSRQLAAGAEVLLYGKVAIYRGRLTLGNPSVDLVGDQTGRIVPVYSQSEKAGLTTRELGVWVREALERTGELADPLPIAWQDELDLVGRSWAFREIHEPEALAASQAARKRLAFDELLRLQVLLVQRKRMVERQSVGIRHVTDGALVDAFIDSLPFQVTGAQRRAIDELTADLAGPHPMHRLLQGDVGSGKTLVALAALLTGVQGGHQGAFLAPTEVLAEQHEANVRELVRGLTVTSAGDNLFGERPVRIELLTGRTTTSERGRLLGALAGGEIDILIGTHALLTETVEFRDLGVVVVDEQHRFGVEQRSLLREKGAASTVPDVLVMTATPIPRTAAMTVYGDLDVTVLDELPPGRTPISTVWALGPLAEAETWAKVRAEVEAGHQAYVVCPLVEESERIQASSATKEYERLAAGELAGLRLGLLHGQLPARDKEEAMERFRRGETQVLVATTVIEVGVDVANATVMVILDADRFGIAQLHQLRGRVGRGADRSWCYLLGEATTEDGEARLRALERSTDGFALAEVDLDLRGEGTILGVRQKGRNDLKLASLRRDRELIVEARRVAFALVGDGTGLAEHPVLEAEVRDLVDDDEAEYLFKG